MVDFSERIVSSQPWPSSRLGVDVDSRCQEHQNRRLTAGEREIVALVASVNRKKIAEQLRVSETTIRNYLNSIFTKLELSSQLELVFYAQTHGLDKRTS